MSDPVIPPFSGIDTDFIAFNDNLLSFAESVKTGLDFGALHDMLDDAKFHALTETDRIPLLPLGPAPVPADPLAPTVAESRAFDIYNKNEERYTKRTEAVRGFKSAFITSLPPNTLQALRSGDTLLSLSLSTLYARLCAKFLPTNAILVKRRAQLNTPYAPPNDVEAHIEVHRHFASAQQPIGASDKYSILLAAIEPCQLFGSVIQHYLWHPADQTFEHISASIIDYSKSPSFVSSATNRYANAVGDTQSRSAPRSERAPECWCWTHGIQCSHNIHTATRNAPAGGNMKVMVIRRRV